MIQKDCRPLPRIGRAENVFFFFTFPLSKFRQNLQPRTHPSRKKNSSFFKTRSTLAYIQLHNHTLFLSNTVSHPPQKTRLVRFCYRNYPHLVCSPPLSVIFLLHESAIILLYYVKHIKHTIFVHHSSSVHCGKHLVSIVGRLKRLKLFTFLVYCIRTSRNSASFANSICH